MVNDATYSFFDDNDRKVHHAPIINTTRVVKRGGLRGGSVPPVHLVSSVSRTGSVPPKRSSVVIGGGGSGGGRGFSVGPSAPFSRLSVATSTASGSPFVTLSGYQPRPVARRASIAAPGGSTVTIWRLGSRAPSALSRELSEVTKGTAALRSVYRPSSQGVYGRPNADLGLHQSVFGRSAASLGVPRASTARSSSSFGVPRAATVSSAFSTRAPQSNLTHSAVGSFYGASRSRPPHRRASVSTFGWHDDEGFGDSTEIPLTVRPYSSKGLVTTKPSATAAKRFSIKTSTNDVASFEKHPKKFVDNNVHFRKKLDVESQLNALVPSHDESLAQLRARAQQAKEHLGRHRILLDRYLPVQLGPENDVNFEVEARYGELVSRMPHLEQRDKSRKAADEYKTIIPPYKPAAETTKGQKLLYEISNIPVKSNFAPKMSDTRKRARSVLCKIKGDPRYYDF